MLQVQLKEKSKDGQDDLLKRIRNLEKKKGEAGWIDSQNHASGYSTAELAYILEYGGEDSSGKAFAPFSFVTISTLDAPSDSRLTGIIKKGLPNYLKGSNYVDPFMRELAMYFAREIVDTMGDPSKLRSNLPATVASKGGRNTPTVDTGELQAKVRTRVVGR